jgi:asparagine N-glycosylation enzyme membrane subunit Stt3
MKKEDALKVLNNRWFQLAILLALLSTVLFFSSSVRLSNLHLLKDGTTGESIPLALDPFYFLRIAETYVENGGTMPEYDELRYNPIYPTLWHHEMHPFVTATVYMFISNYYPEITLAYLHNISPVIYFIIGLIIFFLISYYLTKNQWLALLASSFLAFTPAFLYRTMAGFSDHESVGMTAFLFAVLMFVIAINNIGRKKDPYWRPVVFGALVGFGSTLTIAFWTGVANIQFLMFPIAAFLIWIFNAKKSKTYFAYNFIIFYISWIVFTFLFGLLFGYDSSFMLNFLKTSENIFSLGMIGFFIIDTLFLIYKNEYVKEKYRLLYSAGVSAVMGSIALWAIGRNPFSVVISIINKLIIPFGKGRFGTTVAENQAPYLGQWIAQTGSPIFWMFIFGIFLLGYQLTKRIKDIKHKILFLITYLFMVSGIIFSKYSPTSILNGENFVSIAFYFIPLIVFWIVLFYILFEDKKFRWTNLECFIFAWMFFTMISGRAAARMFFTITPFVCFMAAYFVLNLYKEWDKSKDKVMKLCFIIFFIIAIFFSATSINQAYKSIEMSAKNTGPSANVHWQGAMSWVRENTEEGSVFAHWWDYGYWVESLGQRKTVADGGHFQGAEDGNHKIGRYVLTTPRPETALSYFKSMNVDYLLIDPTELGKYSAYSRIGSNSEWDRFSMIPIGVSDPRRTQETNNQTISVYASPSPNQAFGVVDEDIEYDSNGDGIVDIFLPGPTYTSTGDPSYKAYLGAVYFKQSEGKLMQPEAIYIYNSQQYNIPIKYVYINNELYEFSGGIDSVVRILPNLGQASVDPTGAMIYLSPKVASSLYAQLYLLDDAFENYPTIKVAHSELDPFAKQLEAQGYGLGELLYYGGLRGPIKIWDTRDIPEGINALEEFPERLSGDFAGLDDLKFKK